MTTAIETPPQVPPATRRRRLAHWPAIVVTILAAAAITGAVYVNTYQPLSDGMLTGPATDTIKSIWDGVTQTNWILVGPEGTRGTVDYTLANNGPFAVQVQPVNPHLVEWETTLRWAPLNGPNGGGDDYEAGLVSESRPLPVTLRPGGQIIVEVTVTQPHCTGSTIGNIITDVPISWNAFGVHHVWDLPLTASQFDLPIIVCPSKAALAHIRP
jgi:hypothetical protein